MDTTRIKFRNFRNGVSKIVQGERVANLIDTADFPRTVQIIPTMNNSWAPMGVLAKVRVTGFLTDDENLWYSWDWGEPNGNRTELPQNIKMLATLVNPEWADPNKFGGQASYFVYDNPGNYTLNVTVKDIDGTEVSASYTFNVFDTDEELPNLIVIDPDGDFTWNGRDYEAEGHECLTRIPESGWSGLKDTQILMRRGRDKQHPMEGDRVIQRLSDVYVRGFGDGDGEDRHVYLDFGLIAGYPNSSGERIVFEGLKVSNPDRWNAVEERGLLTEGGTEEGTSIGQRVFSYYHTLIYNCYSDGPKNGHNFNPPGGCEVEPQNRPDSSNMIVGGECWNYRDFGIFGAVFQSVIAGTVIMRDPEAMQGGAGGLHRRYPNGDVDGDGDHDGYIDDKGDLKTETPLALRQNNHGPARQSGISPQGYMIYAFNDWYSGSGWSREGHPYKTGRAQPAAQPVIRLVSSGADTEFKCVISSNIMEGVLVLQTGINGDISLTIENNIFMVSMSPSHVTGGSSGVVARNNLFVHHTPINSGYGYGYGAPFRANGGNNGNAHHDTLGKKPVRWYGNTNLVWASEGSDRSWLTYVEGQSVFVSGTPYLERLTIEEHDNFTYAPFLPSAVTDGLAAIFDLPVAARHRGLRWQNKWAFEDGDNPRDDGEPREMYVSDYENYVQLEMDRSLEFPSHIDLNGSQQKTVAMPVSSQQASGPNPLYEDFWKRDRSAQTVTGCSEAVS